MPLERCRREEVVTATARTAEQLADLVRRSQMILQRILAAEYLVAHGTDVLQTEMTARVSQNGQAETTRSTVLEYRIMQKIYDLYRISFLY